MFKSIKKYLLLFVVVASLVCSVAFTACGEQEQTWHTHDYTYVSEGEDGHHEECKEDGTRKLTEPHSYGSDNKCTKCGYEHVHDYKYVSDGEAGHHQECKSGDNKKETVAHNFGENDVCSDCGYKKPAAGHEHVHDYKYVSDGEAGHHEECKNGDDKKATVPHNFGDDDVCDDCGYKKPAEHVHDYKYVSDGEAGHHQECKAGDDKKATVPHNFGDDDVCDDCGYKKPADHEHDYKYVSDGEAGHHRECTKCDEVGEIVPHSFVGDGICDYCGYKNPSSSGHVHNYKYVSDGEAGHHQECSAGDSKTPTVPHNFGSNNVCSDCGYKKAEVTPGEKFAEHINISETEEFDTNNSSVDDYANVELKVNGEGTGFFVHAKSRLRIDASKKTYGDTTYTLRLNFGGSIDNKTGGNSISFTVGAGKKTITVVFSQSAGRYLDLYKKTANGFELVASSIKTTDVLVAHTFTVENTENTEYYLGSNSNGMYIWELTIAADGGTVNPPVHEHDYKFVSDGEAGHHQACKDGDDVKATVPHNFGNDDVCDDCGYKKPAEHVHDYEYVSDGEAGHHQACKDGDDVKATVPHNFGNDDVCDDCNYKKPEVKPVEYTVTINYGEGKSATLKVTTDSTISIADIILAIDDEAYTADTIEVYTDAQHESEYTYEPVTSDVTLYVVLKTTGGEENRSTSWTVTVVNKEASYEKGTGLTVAYSDNAGGTTSANADDFKFDGNNASVTLTLTNLKAGQTVTVTVTGYTGSNGNGTGIKYIATNAKATQDCPANIPFDSTTTKTAQATGTFTFTVNADGTVTIQLLRSESRTARVTKIEIAVKDGGTDVPPVEETNGVIYKVDDDGKETGTEIAANGTITDNNLFTITNIVKSKYSTLSANTKGLTFNLTNENGYTPQYGIVTSGSSSSQELWQIKAKGAVKVILYIQLSDSKYNSNKTGTWTITLGGESKTVESNQERTGVIKLEIDLKEGETASVAMASSSSVYGWLFAAEGIAAEGGDVTTPSADISTTEPAESINIGTSEETATTLKIVDAEVEETYEITIEVPYAEVVSKIAMFAAEDEQSKIADIYAIIGDDRYTFSFEVEEDENETPIKVIYTLVFNIGEETEVKIYSEIALPSVTIVLAVSESKIDGYERVLQLGESTTVKLNEATDWVREYDFTAPQYGYYQIEVSGVEESDISVNNGEVLTGDGKGNYKFYAAANELFEGISIYSQNKSEALTFTMVVTRLPDGDFTLGEAKEVELHTSTYTEKNYYFVAPVSGVYKLEFTGATANDVWVKDRRDGDIPITVWEETTSGTFAATLDEEVKLGFYQAYGAKTCSVTITLIEAKDNILVVGGEPTAYNIGGEESPANVKIEGLKADREYLIKVYHTQAFGKLQRFNMIYAGQSYSIEATADTSDELGNYWGLTFTAVEGVDSMVICTTNGQIIKKVNIAIVEIKTAEGPVGPQEGDSVTFTPANSEAGAQELPFAEKFVAGNTYTLKITNSSVNSDPEAFTVYNYYVVYGNGASDKVLFNRTEENWVPVFYATFTATDSPVKFYGEHSRQFNGATVEIVLTVSGVVVPKLIEEGDNVTFTPANTETSAKELPFEGKFVAGNTYTLKITNSSVNSDPEAFTVYNYYVVYGNGASDKVLFNRTEENWVPVFYATFTATDAPVKFYGEHSRQFNGATVEIVLTVTKVEAPVAVEGVEVGDSITFTPANSEGGALELAFEGSFVAGKTYTLKITNSSVNSDPEAFTVYNYYVVYGNGANDKVLFNRTEENWVPVFYATFTATDAPVKFYGEHSRQFNGATIEIVLTVTEVA